MTRQKSKYIKIIPDSKPMKAIRQKLMKFPDFSDLVKANFIHPLGILDLPPSRAELMKAYQKGWDDRKAYEKANAKERYDYISGSAELFFPIYKNAMFYKTYPFKEKPKKSWKVKK